MLFGVTVLLYFIKILGGSRKYSAMSPFLNSKLNAQFGTINESITPQYKIIFATRNHGGKKLNAVEYHTSHSVMLDVFLRWFPSVGTCAPNSIFDGDIGVLLNT